MIGFVVGRWEKRFELSLPYIGLVVSPSVPVFDRIEGELKVQKYLIAVPFCPRKGITFSQICGIAIASVSLRYFDFYCNFKINGGLGGGICFGRKMVL